jgi:hypothetical protein
LTVVSHAGNSSALSAALRSPGDPVSQYSRQNPSPRYRELVTLYQQVHREGIPEQNLAGEDVYVGKSLISHLPAIQALVEVTGAKNLLDYGAGKGRVYTQKDLKLSDGRVIPSVQGYLGVDRITCYDPAVPEHWNFPSERFDGVISTDALEHCPQDDMPWIVEEMFSTARKFVYANVASYPAQKRLPNGENAHATQQPAEWWDVLLRNCAARHPSVTYRFTIREKAGKRSLLQRLLGPKARDTVLSNAA